ncbi:MAG: hypothetical protein ACTHQE_17550 [Thermomicrobiales bacterium]
MDANRFDTVTRLFADRRSRRHAMKQGAAGLGAGVLAAIGIGQSAGAQDASPVASPPPGKNTETLFLQAYQSGSITPNPAVAGQYTLTLDQGLGQTVFFSDRPARTVGTTPTADFMANIGFADTDPPNAALVVEREGGETEIAVIELLDPSYDPATRTATYEVTVLDEWQRELGIGFAQAPDDLASFGSTFGAAHLFIDDCADGYVICNATSSEEPTFNIPAGFCYVDGCCQPCTDGSSIDSYWAAQCYAAEPGACYDCTGGCENDGNNYCTVAGWSTWLIPCAD